MNRSALLFIFGSLLALNSVAGFYAVPVRAEEDDGTPYRELAVQIGLPSKATVLGVANVDYWAEKKVSDYLKLMEDTALAAGNPERQNSQCAAFHDVTTSDRVIDIRYAFGYFDSTPDGGHYIYENLDWGRAASVDEGAGAGVRKVLLDVCPNAERRLCGFTEVTSRSERMRTGETVLTRDMTVQNRPVEVRITLSYASASPFYARNTGVLRAKQSRYSETSEENFFGGLRTADYAFYVGHSRNGGGPDFNPPRLSPAGKADYAGYYRKVFPGRTRMLQELAKGSNKNVMVGLFSCDSNLHFRGRLLAQNAKRRAVLTTGTTGSLDYFDVMRGSIGYLEGLLRGTCGAKLDDFARATAAEKRAYQQYGSK